MRVGGWGTLLEGFCVLKEEELRWEHPRPPSSTRANNRQCLMATKTVKWSMLRQPRNSKWERLGQWLVMAVSDAEETLAELVRSSPSSKGQLVAMAARPSWMEGQSRRISWRRLTRLGAATASISSSIKEWERCRWVRSRWKEVSEASEAPVMRGGKAISWRLRQERLASMPVGSTRSQEERSSDLSDLLSLVCGMARSTAWVTEVPLRHSSTRLARVLTNTQTEASVSRQQNPRL